MLYINFLAGLLSSASIATVGIPVNVQHTISPAIVVAATSSSVPDVPFYSQLRDIQAPGWRKLGCGVASMAMLIEFYHPGTVSVNTLLKEGIAAGAYAKNAGWKHKDLALLAKPYGLDARSYDLSHLTMTSAFAQFKNFLKEGPVIASIYYTFDPKNPIPHLAVINGIEGDRIYYNDPAGDTAGKEIAVADFMNGWKKRFIVIKP